MGLFDKRPEVSMTGTEYIKYLEYKKNNKKKLTKNQQQAIVIFAFCTIGILVAIGLIDHVTSVPSEVKPLFSNWYSAAPDMATLSWNSIAKIFAIMAAPVLLIIVAISWIVHGVQLRILA